MIYNKYYNQLADTDMTPLEEINSKLNIPKNSSSNKALEAIDKLLKKLNTVEEARINELVDSAYASGKISTEDKGRYKRMAKVSFEDTKEILHGIVGKPPKFSIASLIKDANKHNAHELEKDDTPHPTNRTGN